MSVHLWDKRFKVENNSSFTRLRNCFLHSAEAGECGQVSTSPDIAAIHHSWFELIQTKIKHRRLTIVLGYFAMACIDSFHVRLVVRLNPSRHSKQVTSSPL